MSYDVLAIIPARSGSKRVPNKNLKEVAEIPLVGHAVRDAKRSNQVNDIIVSTDSEEIATVAEQYGAEVPFLRPDELSTDTAPTTDVILHAIDRLRSNDRTYDLVVLLQPTSPFRNSNDVDECIVRHISNPSAQSVVSVSEYDTPPQWAVVQEDSNKIQPYHDDCSLWSDEYLRSQESQVLHPNGAVFVMSCERYENEETFYVDETYGYKMPRERSLDIDTPADLQLARVLADEILL